MRYPAIAFAHLLFFASIAAAQEIAAIQDNSFLVEEAYNQEQNVIQHISVFTRDARTSNWLYAFTQEWPWKSQTHQLSYTLQAAHAGTTSMDNVMLNYRYQLYGNGEAQLAIAPRLSVSSTHGNLGVQFNLPVSRTLTTRLVSHTNLGASRYRDRTRDVTLGQSFIYAMSARMHGMIEAAWTRTSGRGAAGTTLVVAPGIRWAHNRPRRLQIVPGVAFPISRNDRSVFFYLSFEHQIR